MTKIESVGAREILDSRGYPTVEATVVVAGGASGTGAVPSGASTGEHEAVELRDGDRQRYGGKGVRRAVANVNDVLAPALRGLDAADQAARGPVVPEAIRQGVEVYHALRRLLDARGLTTAVGDEGGFAPALGSHEEALDLLVEAIGAAGLTPGRDVSLALDPAASELVEDGGYAFRKSSGKRCTPDDLIALYESWCKAYPIVSIEDGLGENDWAGWERLTAAPRPRGQPG